MTSRYLETFRTYLGVLLLDRRLFVQSNANHVATIALNVTYPLALAALFQELAEPNSTALGALLRRITGYDQLPPGLLVGVLLVALFVLEIARNWLAAVLQSILDAQASGAYLILASRALESFLAKSLNNRRANPPALLQSLLTRLLFAIKGLQTGLVGRVVPSGIEAVISVIVVAVLFGPIYVALFAALIACFVIFSFAFSRKTDATYEAFQSNFGRSAATLGEIIEQHDQVVSYGGSRTALRWAHESLQGLHASQLEAIIQFQRFFVLQSAAVYTLTYAILSVLSAQIFSGQLNVSALVLMTTYLFQFTAPLNTIGFYLRDGVRHLSVIDEVNSSLGSLEPSKVVSRDMAVLSTEKSPGRLELRGVSYRFPGQEKKAPLLEKVSFSLEGPAHVALVGRNGAGKTTLARLIAGQVSPTTGEILVNGVAISRPDGCNSADLVRYVPQDPAVFSKSVLDNIAFPRSSAEINSDLVYRLLSKLDDTGTLTRRIDNDNEGVAGLSGGERQRILLMRAIINAAPVIIFDEAISAVDAVTSQTVMSVVREFCSDRLVIYITHSPQFAAACDLQIEISEGNVSLLRERTLSS